MSVSDPNEFARDYDVREFFATQKHIAILTPFQGVISAEWAFARDAMKQITPMNATVMDIPKFRVGKELVQARIDLWNAALSNPGVDIALWLDDDVFPPSFALKALMETMGKYNAYCVTGIYWSKMPDPAKPEPTIFDDYGKGPLYNWEPCTVFPIKYAGLGCTMVNVKQIRKLMLKHSITPRECFDWDYRYNDIDKKQFKAITGEDAYFYRTLINMGVVPYCDSRVLCFHQDKDTGKMYPSDAEFESKLGEFAVLYKQSIMKREIVIPCRMTNEEEIENIEEEYKRAQSLAPEGDKLNIGCGYDYRDGFINVDKSDKVKADVYCEVGVSKLNTIDDDTVGYVFCKYVLNFVDDVYKFMEEIYRVSKDGAYVDVIVPHAFSHASYRDPSAKRHFVESSFIYFDKRLMEINKNEHNVINPVEDLPDIDIRLVSMYRNTPPNMTNKGSEFLHFAMNHFNNSVVDMRLTLMVCKSDETRAKAVENQRAKRGLVSREEVKSIEDKLQDMGLMPDNQEDSDEADKK
jgi:hypothetical protein